MPGYSGKVFKREGSARGPLEALWGPNIAREIVKVPTVLEWPKVGLFVLNLVEHELSRLFG